MCRKSIQGGWLHNFSPNIPKSEVFYRQIIGRPVNKAPQSISISTRVSVISIAFSGSFQCIPAFFLGFTHVQQFCALMFRFYHREKPFCDSLLPITLKNDSSWQENWYYFRFWHVGLFYSRSSSSDFIFVKEQCSRTLPFFCA